MKLLEDEKQKCGLVFPYKAESKVEECKSNIPLLILNPERTVLGGGQNHILIESDNYPALLALQNVYNGKIDVIYIDPPYNGGKDFIYNDKFVDKEDTWRHSKWLSFMKPRLELGRELLSESGVIFISIDDNEQAQLKLLCDSIFGESNFVGNIVWRCRSGANDPDNSLSTDHEYILIYAKSNFNMRGVDKDLNRYKNPDNDVRGDWVAGDLRNPHEDEKMMGTLIDPATGNQFKGYWRISPNNYTKYIEDGRILFPKNKSGVPKLKRFKAELKSDKKPYSTFVDGFLTQHGTADIKDIFGNKAFDYSKPYKLLKEILFQSSNKTSIVLDFFAGSGTTFQAVAELNKEDGGNRQCILITNNENNICENITYERCKKVINGYTTPKGKVVEGTKGNLYYFKQEFIPANEDRDQKILDIS